jgi:glycosyltransferase involved in cell wall biosynthesis
LYREIGIRDIGAFIEIYSICKRERFDIVHTHSTKPGIIGRIAAKLAHVPLVIHTVHGLSFHDFVKFPRWHFYWICEMIASFFCDNIVLVNNYYRKYFKLFKSKVITIYNGVNFLFYSREPNERDN